MTLCQHGMILGICPRCDDEVTRLFKEARRRPLGIRDIRSLNHVQRSDFEMLLRSRTLLRSHED